MHDVFVGTGDEAGHMTISENAGQHQARGGAPARGAAQVIARWPSLVGVVVLAGLAVLGFETHLTAMIIMIAAVSYLLTAAFNRPRAGWIALPATAAVAAIGMLTALDAIVLLLVLGGGAGAFGLLYLPRRAWRALGMQFGGFVLFVGLGLGAMMMTPVAAALVVGGAALAHAAWGVVHLRRGQVVAATFAEFLVVVEVGLGVVTLIVAAVSVVAA